MSLLFPQKKYPSSAYQPLTFLLGLLGFGIFLGSMAILALHYPIEVSLFTHILVPVVVVFKKGMETFFGVIKVYTLVICRGFILFAVLGYGAENITWSVLVLLQINILEAVLLDAYKSAYWNALAGIFLMATAWLMPLAWTGKAVILLEDYTYWIIAYCIWNWQFLTRHVAHPYLVGHTIILLVPLVGALLLGNTATWIMLRELTLSSGIILLAIYREQFKPWVFQYISTQQFEAFKAVLHTQRGQLCFLGLNMGLLLLQFLR